MTTAIEAVSKAIYEQLKENEGRLDGALVVYDEPDESNYSHLSVYGLVNAVDLARAAIAAYRHETGERE